MDTTAMLFFQILGGAIILSFGIYFYVKALVAFKAVIEIRNLYLFEEMPKLPEGEEYEEEEEKK